jgi:hypothetical protein
MRSSFRVDGRNTDGSVPQLASNYLSTRPIGASGLRNDLGFFRDEAHELNFLLSQQIGADAASAAPLPSRWNARNEALCLKNRANAEGPKSAIAMLPRRPFRASGEPVQTVRNPARRGGKSSIPMVNHFSADLGILKMHNFATFRIAGRRHS